MMTCVVLLSGGAGWLASWIMRCQGLQAMAWRYPLAVAIAYLVFLLLLWAWLRLRGEHLPDLPLANSDDAASSARPAAGEASPGGAGDGNVLDGMGLADELLWPILVVLALAALLLSAAWVIYSAPALLAELLVDGALVGGLYRRASKLERRHWLRAALRHTLGPAVLSAALLSATGYGLQLRAPAATTLGEVFSQR